MTKKLDETQAFIEGLALVDPTGAGLDLVNAIGYGLRGQWGNAGVSAFAMIPFCDFIKANRLVKTGTTLLRPLGLGSTGRIVAGNLVEEMTMKAAMENPAMGQVIMEGLTDSRWLGWSKMELKTKTENGVNAVVHYVGKWENGVLTAVDDFKFK